MLQHYQVGDGPLWVIHIVVGTPWFITQTDSVGCLLRCCRWVSINIQNKNNNKNKLLHKLCIMVEMMAMMTTSAGAGRGEMTPAWRVKKMCSVSSSW